MNKKATDKIISVYWFAILIIVAGGIFAMVYAFYSNPYDSRELEANILANNIANCLSYKGSLREKIINDEGKILLNKDNFLKLCNLNFNVEDEYNWKEKEQYYIQISFYNVQQQLISEEVFAGNTGLISSCEIQEDNEYEKLAKCIERRFYTLDKNQNQYLIKILSVVRKTEKNVK
ncbi:MAG: hypothetical protein KJ646_01950 [Nanoarchaeota archaeon]|nr:hypothetical protein [Nanoarchaeota archaeon]MBU4116847.1 hypothetical protein [Nanoarchaeota archaeon]